MRLAILIALFAFVGGGAAHATEITPTPKMLADAREMIGYRWPDEKGGPSGSFTFETSTDTFCTVHMPKAETAVFASECHPKPLLAWTRQRRRNVRTHRMSGRMTG
jgi:hypothetical protein